MAANFGGENFANSGKSWLTCRLRGPGRPKGFARTEEDRMRHPRGKLGISKRKVNMALRRASILGDDLGRVVRTSLDKGVELDALIKLHPAVRKVLIAWAADGENVSSRNKLLIDLITEELITMGVIEPGEVTA